MPLRCSSCSWVVFSASWSPREACVGVLPLTPLVPDLPSNDLHLIPLDALWCSQDGHALKQFSCSVGAHGVNVNPSLGQPAITGSQDRHVSPLSERGQDRALSQSPWAAGSGRGSSKFLSTWCRAREEEAGDKTKRICEPIMYWQ